MSQTVSGSTTVPSSGSSSAPITIAVDSYSAIITVDTWQQEWPKQIKQLGKDASKYVLLTDTNLDRLYGTTLKQKLEEVGLTILYLVLPPGEQTKSRATKAQIEDWMFAHACGRDTVMLAFGGGVIGDLTGYIASGYMRGIPFIQLPTSFLAMVDSSIGGKTGIDTPAGKNLLGAFHRPLAVLIDLSLLLTLPQRELCNGMAESIKAGIIASLELFELMESNVDGLLRKKDLKLLAAVVEKSVAIKAHVVLNDEKEAGLRSILNFGHSIGHAIEAFMQPELLHGECVAIGMIEEIILARGYGLVGSGELRRVDNILKSYSLPTRVPSHLTSKQLLDKMSIDKKNKGGKKELVLVTSIGSVKSHPKYTTMVPDADLELLLAPSIGVTPVAQPITGSVAVPGSKSLSNRILLLAAMGSGSCLITGLLHSQDTQVMLDSLRELGIAYEWVDGLKKLRIHGCEGRLRLPSKPLFLNNAGTASRFLTSLVCLIPSGEITLTGNARMQERPIGDLVNSLRQCGNSIEYLNRSGCLPLKITGNGSGLKGGPVKLAANISSQYVSSILLSAPYAANEDLVLSLDVAGKKVVSKPFIEMTVELMKRFNIDVKEIEPFVYRVKRGAYRNPLEFQVEGDASSATYPLALAAVSGGAVTVENVGSDSLQGDAQFYKVLQAMGCTVSQTDTTTTVRGPDFRAGQQLKSVEMDMDAMTDTFMTLAAVAVFAVGTTKITNIANQRVKECNRIAVMVSELKKCGVKAEESETGLDIHGLGLTEHSLQIAQDFIQARPHHSAVIECHDDHRIAMSFALIGTRLRGIILDEKRCVDKTYPEFWEDLSQRFGVSVFPPKEGVVPTHSATTPSTASSSSSWSSSSSVISTVSCASIILIGMRGSGKTYLGRALAEHLHRPFLDLDEVLEAQLGTTCKAFVEKEGWVVFRERELEVLVQSLKSHPLGYVISCGGGIVETPAAVTLLKKQPLVVQLRRHIDDVVAYLDSDSTRPTFDARSVWTKREPLYTEASRYEFVINRGDLSWQRIEYDFFGFINSLLHSNSLRLVRNTFFLSLTIPDLSTFSHAELQEMIDSITKGADAIEVRVDMITPTYDEEKVKSYIASLRSVTQLPLIYTVRSKKQGGFFTDYEADAAGEAAMLKQLSLGFRLGCAFIDIEVALSAATRQQLFILRREKYPDVRIIASHHEPKTNGGSNEELSRIFERCARAGGETDRPDVVKVVIFAFVEMDGLRLVQVSNEVEASFASQPPESRPAIIALAMGPAGKISRVYNRVLTPVTHPLLPTAAAPGQLSIAQILKLREGLSLFPFDAQPITAQKRWYLFGSPITHSPSPLLHNTAFEWNHLAPTFEYLKCDTSSIEVVAATIAQSDFGGGNVTIPLKEAACSLVATRSSAVDAIGALNTIIRRPDGSLHGENTDWLGFHQLISSRLPILPPASTDVAIVIGAGGTARAAIYAIQHLGFSNQRIIIFNPRTKEKATSLAQQFHVQSVASLDRPTISQVTQLKDFTIRLIVSTIPGSGNLRLDDTHLLDQQIEKPIVMDATYIPADTTFLLQCMNEFDIPSTNVIRGIDLLIAQGLFGMSYWLGKSLPITCAQLMERTVRLAYREKHSQSNASVDGSPTASMTR